MRLMASSAKRSVVGPCVGDIGLNGVGEGVHAGVRGEFGGMVKVKSGSMRATSGTMALLTMAILTLRAVSLMMANWDTSAELPAVVGMQR
jgi:hypothetical protein